MLYTMTFEANDKESLDKTVRAFTSNNELIVKSIKSDFDYKKNPGDKSKYRKTVFYEKRETK